jgi:hypothetical protein
MAKNKPSFEEMKEIYENWSNYDKTGTQAEVFKKNGWSRTAYFNECYYIANPEERPLPKEHLLKKIKP